MIINGGARSNVGYWSGHLTNTEKNDRAEVLEISGLLSEDLPTALKEMKAIADQSRCEGNFMYHANINPRDDERLTPEQWKIAVDDLEKALGMEGHQRIVVEHEKDGRTHQHVIWNRVDVETLRVVDIGGNFYTHERVARDLEQKFELAQTQSLHGEQRPDGRPERPAELWEKRASERSGIDAKEIKAELTDLWHNTDSGKAFAAALDERGYILTTGDRRAFCVVDHAGDVHSLARRLDGVNTREVNERLADIDRASLPTVTEAKAIQAERYPEPEAAQEAWKARDQQPAPVPVPENKPAPQTRQEGKTPEKKEPTPEQKSAPASPGLRVAGPGLDVAVGLADFVTGLLAGKSAALPTESAPAFGYKSASDEQATQRRALYALSHIRESMERGEDLSASDVQNLTPTHLENIKAKGDDYMRELIERVERDRERERDYSRDREL